MIFGHIPKEVVTRMMTEQRKGHLEIPSTLQHGESLL